MSQKSKFPLNGYALNILKTRKSRIGDYKTVSIKGWIPRMASIVEVCLSEDDQQQTVLYVDREALCKHSEYFNTGLSDRWKQSQRIELQVAKSDWSKYETCILLTQDLPPPKFKFSSVEQALEILEPASRFLCSGIVNMCMDFLGCMVWSKSEKLEISSTLARLGLPLSSEIAKRLEGCDEADRVPLLRKVVRSETRRDESLMRELIDSVMESKPEAVACFFEEEWMLGWSELKAEWSKPTSYRTPKFSFIELIPLAISYNMCNAKMVEVLFSDLKVTTPKINPYGIYQDFVSIFFDAVRELVNKVLNGEVVLPYSARKEITLALCSSLKEKHLKSYVSVQHVKDLASTLGWKDYEAAIESLFT